MNKRKIITALTGLFIIISILLTLIQNKPKNQVLEESFFYLGTIIKITLYDTDNQVYMDEIETLISHYDELFDRNNENSEINILNTNKKHKVSESSYNIISTSIEYSKLTSGYFDITINPIVDLWQIGTAQARIPSEEEIDAVLQSVDYNNITLSKDYTVTLEDNTTVDLGAIAKGFIADELKKKMTSQGIKKALINLGGNVYVLGSSPDDTPWNIGIKHPEENHTDNILKLMLSDKSIVTSGVTERFFVADDKRYHHILNPFTGYPINNNILSVTIISDESIDGDALATGMFALGIDASFDIINKLKGIEMLVVSNDKRVYYSSSLTDTIELFDTSYQLIKK